MTNSNDDTYPETEAAQREDDVLRRMLSTPPKPHDSSKESTKREARQRPKPSGGAS